MGRPPLPVGTAGEVRIYPVRDSFRARCKVRDYDGKVRDLERSGPTVSKAKVGLREAVRDRHRVKADAEITSGTKLADVVRIWLVDLRAEVATGEKSPGTGELYETSAQRSAEGLGALRVREATVGRSERFLTAISANNGPVSAKRAKTVLTGVLGLAARHDAIKTKPRPGHGADQVRGEEERSRARPSSGLRPEGEAGRRREGSGLGPARLCRQDAGDRQAHRRELRDHLGRARPRRWHGRDPRHRHPGEGSGAPD